MSDCPPPQGLSGFKNGFTLVEMSIVLVIIGLIAGGILTGQELISTATLRAQISQIEKYNSAVHTFQNKYGGLPGDLALNLATQFGFNVYGCNGTIGNRDGNGAIDGFWGPSQLILEWGEATLFWADLGQAGLIDGTYPNNGATYGNWNTCAVSMNNLTLAGGSSYIGDLIPAAKIGAGNFMYVYDSDPAEGAGVDHGNWYGISAVSSILNDGGMTSNPSIPVIQAYRIDQKIDDGFAMSGTVRDLYISYYTIVQGNGQGSDSTTSCYNTTTNKYSIGINGGAALNCALSFRFQ